MSENTQLAVSRPPLVKASTELSTFLGMEVSTMIETIKAQCFKGKRPDEVTDAQLATYVSVANALKLNPLLPGQMYPYPERNGGVTVMIGPDGVFTLLSNHPDVVAQKDGGPAFWTDHGVDATGAETCTGYINHRTKGLLKKTIWVNEWIVGSNPNWQSRRHHMSEIRALKQTARMVIHGLPMDSDEHKLGEILNVTDTVQHDGAQTADGAEMPQPKRAALPKKSKGAAALTPTTPAEATPISAAAVTVEAETTPVPEAAPASAVVSTPTAPEAAPTPVAADSAATGPTPPPAPTVTEKAADAKPSVWPRVVRGIVTEARTAPVKNNPKCTSVVVAKLGGSTEINGQRVQLVDLGRLVFDPERPELGEFAKASDVECDFTIEEQPSSSNPAVKNKVIIKVVPVAEEF